MTLRICSGLLAGCAAVTGGALYYQNKVRKEAIQTIVNNKLTIEDCLYPDGGTTSFKASYGIVENGQHILPPGTVITLNRKNPKKTLSFSSATLNGELLEVKDCKQLKPIITYLKVQFVFGFLENTSRRMGALRVFCEAQKEWIVKERYEGDLGFVNNMQISPLKEEYKEKADFYTVVATLALAQGIQIHKVYEEGIRSSSRVAIDERSIIIEDHSRKIYTPDGIIEDKSYLTACGRSQPMILVIQPKYLLPSVNIGREKNYKIVILTLYKQPPLPTLKDLEGDKISELEDKNKKTWLEIRDHVFKSVNDTINTMEKPESAITRVNKRDDRIFDTSVCWIPETEWENSKMQGGRD